MQNRDVEEILSRYTADELLAAIAQRQGARWCLSAVVILVELALHAPQKSPS